MCFTNIKVEIEICGEYPVCIFIELIVPKENISLGRIWHLGLSRLPEGL
tara:strand:- start:644 stop:790 length:147 start_codon:yes stop_codon:yes gene_type:complete